MTKPKKVEKPEKEEKFPVRQFDKITGVLLKVFPKKKRKRKSA